MLQVGADPHAVIFKVGELVRRECFVAELLHDLDHQFLIFFGLSFGRERAYVPIGNVFVFFYQSFLLLFAVSSILLYKLFVLFAFPALVAHQHFFTSFSEILYFFVAILQPIVIILATQS